MTDLFPELSYDAYAGTAEHLHRLSQIAGKYTLFAPYSVGFGSVTLPLTPRGFATRTLWAGDTTFEIRFDILDDRMTIASNLGTATLPLGAGSISDFYARFSEVVKPLGIPPLRTMLEPEIAGSPHLDTDDERRPYDPTAARAIWTAFASASRALCAWQAAYLGNSPPVGIMFGGFDLFAPRFASVWKTPPASKPMFMQNSETADDVVVGFALGDEKTRTPGFFAYATCAMPEFASADFTVGGAGFLPDAGLAFLPYEAVRNAPNPHATILAFADAVYAAARPSGPWPADLERCDGWDASKTLVRQRL